MVEPVSNKFSDAFFAQTDKYTDKWASYLDVYGSLLDPVRDSVTSVLEIGVQNGGSLEVWARYLPHATKIVGCDIDTACGQLSFADSRITVIVGDVNDMTTKKKVLQASKTFDLVIDDGSHFPEDIIKTFWTYFPHINRGGYLIIEDLSVSYWDDYRGGLAHPESSMQFLKLLADVVNYEHWGTSAQRRDVFAAFSASTGIADEKTLEEVQSVTFVNSMCIIKKAEIGQKSEMGLRLGSGSEALVGEIPLTLRNKPMSRQDQSLNPYADIKNLSHVHVAQERDELAKKVIELEDLNQNLVNSTSWRITRPLRVLKKFFSRRSG
jgi:hypothetical protein